MDKNIIENLDDLTVEQTEELLNKNNKNMEIKISSKERDRIKKSVFEKTGLNSNKKNIYIPRKLAACAAAFVIIFTSLAVMGFDNVYAAIRNLFTFVPGIGIEEKSDGEVYTIEPIIRQAKSESQAATANIVNAVYSNGYLSITVEVQGKALYHDDFELYINQEKINYREEGSNMLTVSYNSTMYNFSLKTDVPGNNIYEIAMSGFPERLAFKMILCNDYDEIIKIGPTDTKNGISITTTSQLIDEQLVVWCYPFKADNSTKDRILGYGLPANGAFNTERYIETENGQIFEKRSGWLLDQRLIFDINKNIKNATLHIPYLAMLRDEKNKLNINLPKEYINLECDYFINCSLGKIKVIEIKREPNKYQGDKDTIWLKFEFESINENEKLYSVVFQPVENAAMHFDAETGCLEYLELYVGKNENKVALKITNLFYYLFGEYVIDLDVQTPE